MKWRVFIEFYDYTTLILVPATSFESYNHLFWCFAFIPANRPFLLQPTPLEPRAYALPILLS
jgi:hypothetical protein